MRRGGLGGLAFGGGRLPGYFRQSEKRARGRLNTIGRKGAWLTPITRLLVVGPQLDQSPAPVWALQQGTYIKQHVVTVDMTVEDVEKL